MIKFYLTLIHLITFTASTTLAQTKHSISIGPNIGLGANFGRSSKPSLGASLDYTFSFSDKLAARTYVSYNKFGNKGSGFVSFLPIRVGLQGYLYENVFFGFADAGIAAFKASSGTNQTRPSWSLGVGYNQLLDERNGFKVTASFNHFQYRDDDVGQQLNYTWFIFSFGYSLNFGKLKGKNVLE